MHRIHTFSFWGWYGPPPPQAGQVVESYTLAGYDGVGHQLLGVQGDEFRVEAVAHLGGEALGTLLERGLYLAGLAQTFRGLGLVDVTYEDVPLIRQGHRFKVCRVEHLENRAAIRLVGPGYDYSPGVLLRLGFTLRAHRIL